MLLCSLAALPVTAQITNVTDDTSTPIPGAGHDYIHLLSETVNPANGSLSIRIQVPLPTGREFSLPFSIDYDSDSSIHLQPVQAGVLAFWSNTDYLAQGGWSYSAPVISATLNMEQAANNQACQYTADYSFRDPSGGGHSLNPAGVPVYPASVPSPPPCNFTSNPAVGTWQRGGDDEFGLMIGSTRATTTYPATVADANGTVYYFQDVGSQETVAITNGYEGLPDLEAMPSYIEDRNGNKITINDQHNGSFSYLDTLNRNVLSVSGFGPSSASNTVTVSGLSNPYTVAWETIPYNYSVPYEQLDPIESQDCLMNNQSGTLVVVKSITLPNGEQYTFTYDPTFGRISQITYPDGGWVSYTWKWSDTYSESAIFGGAPVAPATTSQNGACQFLYKTPVIATRSVGFTDTTTPVLTQSFTYDTQWGNGSSEPETTWVTRQTTITTTDEVRSKTASTVYTYGSVLASYSMNDMPQTGVAGQIPVENEVQYYDWGVTPSSSATPLETEVKGWYDADELACDFVSYNAGPNTGHYYQYAYGQISDDKQYDFGQVTAPASQCYNTVPTGAPNSFSAPGSPVRETVTNYTTFTNALGAEYTASTGTTFAEPVSTIVYDHGSEIAETDYGYDQNALTEVSATQHDETNYPSSTIAGRGNATTVTRKCLQGCADAVTTYSYYQTGQVESSTDPCGNTACADMAGAGHTTTYSYADAFTDSGTTGTNAYLTTITYPSADGVTQHEYFKYRYADGQVSLSQDDNDLAAGASVGTAYEYNDPLDRPTAVTYPDGGATWISYNDAAPSPSITTCKLLNSVSGNGTCPISGAPSGSWKSTEVTMDGMGHTVETELTSDPDGTDYVNTSYDGSGLVYQQSNPHRSSAGPTDGTTTFTYDAVGRKVIEQNPDSSSEQWCYNGVSSAGQSNCNGQLGTAMNVSWVDAADANGNDWQRSTDGLGRLVKVMEPNGTSQTPSMQTTYTYDADYNLLTVTQVGDGSGNRSRSFSYDGLSRLITASNPESGAATYSYDANGNLGQKVSPLADSTNGTQTVGYCYDSLNRMTATLGVAPSTTICQSPSTGQLLDAFVYDTSSLPGAANDVGRVTAEVAYNNGVIVAETEPSAYDLMGRVLGEQQCTVANCGGSAYTPGYTYDLGGDIASVNAGLPVGTPGVPSNSLQFGYQYDGAQRLAEITSSIPNSIDYPSTLFQATSTSPTSYGPAGLTYALDGVNSASSQPAISLTRTYDDRLRVSSETDTASEVITSQPESGSGAVTVAGSEKMASYSSGSVTFSGQEQPNDGGELIVQIGGTDVYPVPYGPGSTTQTLAAYLASIMTCNSGKAFPVQAVTAGSTVIFATCSPGPSTNYSLNTSVYGESFGISTSGSAMAEVATPTPLGGGYYGISFSGSANGTSGAFGIFLYPKPNSGVAPLDVAWGASTTPAQLAASAAAAIGSCSTSGHSVGAIANGDEVDIIACTTGALYSVSASVLGCSCSESQQDSFSAAVETSANVVAFNEAASGAGGEFLVQIYATGNSYPQNAFISFSNTSTTASLAQSLVSTLGPCGTSGTLMSAVADGNLVYLIGCQAGTTYTVTATMVGCSCNQNTGPLFTIAEGATSNLGTIPGPAYDSGTVSLNVNGTQIASTTYGNGSTPASIASALASSNSGSSPVTLAASGSSITMTAKTQGASTDYPYTLTVVSSDPSVFAPASFSSSPSSGSLTGGVKEGEQSNAVVYSYSVPEPSGSSCTSSGVGYDCVGNLSNVTDSATGTWNYTYDTLNRLSKGTASTGPFAGQSGCWNYDGFGNRTSEVYQTSACPQPTSLPATARYNTNNQVTWTSVNGAVNGFQYDDAGNVLYDGANSYLYDLQGRLCAVSVPSVSGGGAAMTEYLYDAQGDRVAKGSISVWSCDIATNGFTATSNYVVGPGGEQMSELSGNGSWVHTNVFADGRLLATYHDTNTYFAINDWLGTKREEYTPSGLLTSFVNLPYGNDLSSSGSALDATEQHFTGKEHDSESGNDYFGARYYANSVGRWLSPDPSGEYFADPQSPQLWNMYSYVDNNPLINIDPGGLWVWNIGECYYDTVAAYVDGQFQGYDTQPIGCFFHPTLSDTLFPTRNPVPPQFRPHPPAIDCSEHPPMPPTPSDANINANERATMKHSALWWLMKVRPGGAWDYKRGGQLQYAAFGNVNFGATCNALGDGLVFCQRGAGAAAYGTAAVNVATGGKWTAGPGNPVSPADDNGMPDYGDQATGAENQSVIAGFGYAQWQKACGKQ